MAEAIGVKSGAIGLEWNALTYAGHTVWNVHNETRGSGYKGGTKRRPREDWVIREKPHEALITSEEAKFIPARQGAQASVELSPDGALEYTARRIMVRERSRRLLPAWHGRKAKPQSRPNSARRSRVGSGDERSAHSDDPVKSLRKELNVESRIGKMMMLAADMDDQAPALREVEALERYRNTLAAEVSRHEQEYTAASPLDNITEAHVKTLLGGITENIDAMNQATLKDFLSNLIDRVTLNPVSHECQVNYRISMDLRNKVASPRSCVPIRNGS